MQARAHVGNALVCAGFTASAGGTVVLAADDATDELVAVKQLADDLLADPGFRADFHAPKYARTATGSVVDAAEPPIPEVAG